MLKDLRIKVRNYFIAGLLTIFPIGVTLYVIGFILKFMGKYFSIPINILQRYNIPIALIHLGGILIASLIIIGVGIFTTNIFGKKLVNLWESLLMRIPLLGGIYTGVKQFSEAIFLRGKRSFSRAVLVEYPRKGLYAIGFVTSEFDSESLREKKMATVFLPTSPNPTSGYFVLVPRKDVTPLNLSVEEGLKLILSAGILTPPVELQEKEK
jgi:uncharacterized membrane protein